MNGAFLALLFVLAPPQPNQSGLTLDCAMPPGGQMITVQFGGRPKPSDEDRERARLRIGITKDQQAQIEQLYADTDRKMREVLDKMRELYRQLNSLYDSYDFDRLQARNLRRQVMQLRRQILEMHGQNEEALRRILNRDQFTRLRQLIKEEHEHRRRDRPGPPGTPSLGRL